MGSTPIASTNLRKVSPFHPGVYMKKYLFILLFFPTKSFALEVETKASASFELFTPETILNFARNQATSPHLQGAALGACGTVILDAILDEIIEEDLPPTCLISIILSSAYGTYCKHTTFSEIQFSLICATLSTIWQLAKERTTNKKERFGIKKNLINGLKQACLNFIAITGSENLSLVLQSP